MSGDGVGWSGGFIDPAGIPESDQVGIDSVTCRCAGRTLSNVHSTIPSAVTMKLLCTNCGDWIEALTQDYPPSEYDESRSR